MALDSVKNFAKVTVSIGYDADDTSIVLSSGHGARLPQPSTDGEFNLVWWNSTDYDDPADDPNVEIVRCTVRVDDTLTVSRGQEGVGASTKNTGGKTYLMVLTLTKKMKDDIWTEISDSRIPAGTKMIFFQASVPTGWTQYTDYNDRALRVVSAIGGGLAEWGSLTPLAANTGNHTLSVAETPSHQHTVPWRDGDGSSATANAGGSRSGGFNTDPTGGGAAHNHPLDIRYVDVIVGTKDAY